MGWWSIWIKYSIIKEIMHDMTVTGVEAQQIVQIGYLNNLNWLYKSQMKYGSCKFVFQRKRKFFYHTCVVTHKITTYVTFIYKMPFDCLKQTPCYGVHVRIIILMLPYLVLKSLYLSGCRKCQGYVYVKCECVLAKISLTHHCIQSINTKLYPHNIAGLNYSSML